MLQSTRVPYVLNALADLFRGDPDFGADFIVLDGPALTGEYPTTFLVIGWTDEDSRGASSTRSSAGIRRNDREDLTVTLALISIVGSDADDGTSAFRLARDNVVAAMTVIERRLAQDINLSSGGSLVLTMGDQSWYQLPVPTGAEVTCVFQLTAKALL